MASNLTANVAKISSFKRCQSTIANPNIQRLKSTTNKYNNKNSAFNFRPSYPKGFNGIFFNPAPTAPTPAKTPNKFLPESDIRKDNLLYNTEVKVPLEYMPELRQLNDKKYHLTKEDIAKMQELRDQGLGRKDIASKFGVSNLFVSLSTNANEKLLEERKAALEKRRSRWSKDKINAKDSKLKRVQLWLRDQY